MTSRADLFDLARKVAIVTGAGSGLGRTFAQGLAAYGAEVVCADRHRARAEETAALIRQAGGSAAAWDADVSAPNSVVEMSDHVMRTFGRVDVLINNAGIATAPARVHEMPIEDWRRLVDVNLTGVFLCTRAIIPAMLAGGRGGSIINIASIVGLVGYYPGFASAGANYAAAKAGVIGFTRQVAVEYARDGIRANAIAPGWHDGTRLGEERRASSSPETLAQFNAAIMRRTPMGRKGRPEELEALAIYLASDASSFVTGQVFAHDGGWTAA
ncbi:MAG: SDR family NAD(P)-dependent oxidoreductase [Alphaproteobacteria bacterium]